MGERTAGPLGLASQCNVAEAKQAVIRRKDAGQRMYTGPLAGTKGAPYEASNSAVLLLFLCIRAKHLATGAHGQQSDNLDILSDTQGIDFGPYVQRILGYVKRTGIT